MTTSHDGDSDEDLRKLKEDEDDENDEENENRSYVVNKNFKYSPSMSNILKHELQKSEEVDSDLLQKIISIG